jgi:hypothetical protein
MVNVVRCNICHQWYSNNRGLLIHLGFCRERHASQQEDKNHQHLEHNPLKSRNDQLDHLNLYAVYGNLNDSSGEDSTDEDCPDKGGLEYSTKNKIGINLGKEDDLANYGGDNTDGQFSTAIRQDANDLILNDWQQGERYFRHVSSSTPVSSNVNRVELCIKGG